MHKIVLALALACTSMACLADEAHAATWKETQKGGWERTCHDGGRTACTVWENQGFEVGTHLGIIGANAA
jgi:hypothetical protein